MKLPFSYKSSLFGPLLLTSLLGHTVFLGVGGFLVSSPEFAVHEAPSSMEVILLKKDEEPPRKELERRHPILTLEDKDAERLQTIERKKTVPEPSEIKKSVVIPPQKGSLSRLDPAHLKNPTPVYPTIAREEGWQGTVILKVLVDAEGRSANVQILKSSGYKVLDHSALKAVRKWRFLPARTGSFSFSSWIKIPIRFVLVEEA